MRVCIHGLGAVGGLMGLFISRATGERVIAKVRRREQAERLSVGFKIRGAIEGLYELEVSHEIPRQECDYTIIATKAYDAPVAVREASSYSRVVVPVSNGFGAVEEALRIGKGVVAGIVEYGVVRLSDAEAEVRSLGRVILGVPRESSADPMPLAELLRKGGASVEVVSNIDGWRWLKGIANSIINPITAVLGAENGAILHEAILPLARCVANEGAAVARAMGIELPRDPLEYTLELAKRTENNRSSMLQDVEACRKTEIEEINGHIERIGRSLGMEVKCVSALRALVLYLETSKEADCRR